MKYVVLIFWALILGQVVGYIASSLAGVSDIPYAQVAVLSLIIAGVVILIQKLAIPDKNENEK